MAPRTPTAPEKASRTAKWAATMTKWHARFATIAGRGSKKTVKRWQFVAFPGAKGAESRGIVDLVAIRRDHRTVRGVHRPGDLFEIIFIQIKGGTAAWPSTKDVARLRAVAKRYDARHVVLASWTKGTAVEFYQLRVDRKRGEPWLEADPRELFR